MKSMFIFLFVLVLCSEFCSQTEAGGRPPAETRCGTHGGTERFIGAQRLPGEVDNQPSIDSFADSCSIVPGPFNLSYTDFCAQLYGDPPKKGALKITEATKQYWLPDTKNWTVEIWPEFYLPCPTTTPPPTLAPGETTTSGEPTTPRLPVTVPIITPRPPRPPRPPPPPQPPGEDGWSTKNYPIYDCDVVCDPDGVITDRNDLDDFFKRIGVGNYGRVKRQASQDDRFCNKTTLIADMEPLNNRWPFSKARIVVRFVGNLSRNATFKHFAADLLHRERVLARLPEFLELRSTLTGAAWVIKGPHENGGFSYAEEFVTLDQDVEIQEMLAQTRFRIPPHPPVDHIGRLDWDQYQYEGEFPCHYVRSRIQEIHAILDAMEKAKASRFNNSQAKRIDSYPSLIEIEEDEEKEEPLDPMVPALISCAVNTVLVCTFFLVMWCAAYCCRPKKSRPSMQPARVGKAGPSTMAVDMGKPSKGSEKSEKSKKKK